MSDTEVDPKVCDLDCAIVEQLQEFLLEARSGTINAYLNKVKNNAKSIKQPNSIPKSILCGVVFYHDGWVVLFKLQDVFGKEKSTKLPIAYVLEKDADLACDFVIKHFCFVINQKMNHKLNFPAETVPIERQAELKCYIEEVLANFYSFQVGKVLPAIPILRGVDQGPLSAFWTIRLSVFASTGAFFVFLPTTHFHIEQEACFAYDHLMPKVRELGNPALSFNPNFRDYQPFVGFEAQLDVYFESHLRLHPVLLSMAVVTVHDVPSSNDPTPLKRLRGVLQRGSGFIVRISVPNSANQAIIHHLPQVYSTGMEAALTYDCITRLLLPYRARPSPLKFATFFATPERSASMSAYFEGHILPLLPDLKDDANFVAAPTKKDRMTLSQARLYFLAQRRDGPVHPCCCCRRTWFKRCIRSLIDKFLEKIPEEIKYALTSLTGPDGVRRLCNICYSSFRRRKAPKMCEANMLDLQDCCSQRVAGHDRHGELPSVAPDSFHESVCSPSRRTAWCARRDGECPYKLDQDPTVITSSTPFV
jgi:hypothetical protein